MSSIRPEQTPIEYYEELLYVRGLVVEDDDDTVAEAAHFMVSSVEEASKFMRGFGQSLRGDRYTDDNLIEERVLLRNVAAVLYRLNGNGDDSDGLEIWQQAYGELEASQTNP